jgi:predicted RND superfamily exporter protein
MAKFLVRSRVVLFCIMAALAVCCAIMIPHTNINTDMTKYLPDDYPMRQGLNVLTEELPDMFEQLRTFGSVFADGNQLIPTDLPRALFTGFSLAVVVLLIMSSSVVEVFLFLITIGFAVVLNMGTNALLPSVSMMTHMLANILQMVLSMDYCIILMNRFRQEKATGLEPVPAMERAVRNASASILSSAFTTIVSLLMLCFMKIKIGGDMGMVLAKGVTISLICNFTVLPCLIIWFDKAIEKTRKKSPGLNPGGLARFESRFRIPLAILFVGAFVLFFFLQRRTPTSFSPNWDSEATSPGSDHNDLLLLYADADSSAVPALLDSIRESDSLVTTCLSYPSLVQRQMTAGEMAAFFKATAGEELPVNEDLLSLVYYVRSHPSRDGKFTVDELLASVDELRAKGLIDRDVDVAGLFGADGELIQENGVNPGRDGISGEFIQENGVNPGRDTSYVEESPVVEEIPPRDSTNLGRNDNGAPATRFTYEEATTPLTAEQMARIAGMDKSRIAMVFRMAGKAGQTMAPLEFVEFVQHNVLNDRRYSAFIPRGAAEQLAQIHSELEAAIAAGEASDAPASAQDNLIPENGLNPGRDGQNDEFIQENEANPGRDTSSVEDSPVVEEILAEAISRELGSPRDSTNLGRNDNNPTPLERLAEMVFSSHRYSAGRVYRALSRAGVPISREELDLLYLYTGAKQGADSTMTLSPEELLGFVADTLINDPALAPMIPDSLRAAITMGRDSLMNSVSILRGRNYSAAVVMSEYEVESDASFAYLENNHALADAALGAPHYWIGGSEMYKELKDGFPAEVLLLTLLTVLAIFIIVAFTFRSVLIPIPLVMTVLTGIYANVWAVGLGGQTMYFISYLIVQGILMGATIDYSILFTGYYLRSRRVMPRSEALASAYDNSIHSILMSGLILTLVPFVMSYAMHDAMICSILKSISAGAATVLMVVLFMLPGVLAAIDKIVIPRKERVD